MLMLAAMPFRSGTTYEVLGFRGLRRPFVVTASHANTSFRCGSTSDPLVARTSATSSRRHRHDPLWGVIEHVTTGDIPHAHDEREGS